VRLVAAPPKIPKGFNHPAQRCRSAATLGQCYNKFYPERVESNAILLHHPAMPQSLAKILVHTVFSTKDRRPFLRDQPLREELHRYLGGILTNRDCQPLIIGGVADHVHILSTLSRTGTAAEMVKEVKRSSSLWLKTKSPRPARFCVAERLRYFLCRLFAGGRRAEIHRRTGGTSSENFVSG